MKQFIFCLLCALLGVSLVYSAEKNIMPPGFESLELGMDWNTFLSRRPHVELFMPEGGERVTPDPNQPQGGLIETFPEGSEFSTGFYVFEQGRLVAVMFGRPLDDEPGHRESFLRKIADKYGMPATINLMKDHKSHGVMIWQTNDVQVHVIVPSNRNIQGQTFLALRMMTHTYAEHIKALEYQEESDSRRINTQTAAVEALREEMSAYVKFRDTSKHHSDVHQENTNE